MKLKLVLLSFKIPIFIDVKFLIPYIGTFLLECKYFLPI